MTVRNAPQALGLIGPKPDRWLGFVATPPRVALALVPLAPCLKLLELDMEQARKPHLEYQRDEHRVLHLVVYHLIWCPRRRRPVLVGPVEARCRALIEQACSEHRWQILTLAIQPDHLHLFVRTWPTDSGADVVKACKGKTSYYLRREFPHLLKLPSMWTRSYFASIMEPTQDAIDLFLDAQKGKP